MLKCGQKDNKNYTFGVRKDQIKEAAKETKTIACPCCDKMVLANSSYCSFCGEKI